MLVAHAAGISNPAIGTAAMVAYTFAIPWVRTLLFTVGFFAQAVVAWMILVR